ncbi:hypothetical protein Gotri_011224, partial [Gossypium trilobum]|nr:hypothetical protein [Gossypium trilobum]
MGIRRGNETPWSNRRKYSLKEWLLKG